MGFVAGRWYKEPLRGVRLCTGQACRLPINTLINAAMETLI
jgi:hypothetical protein